MPQGNGNKAMQTRLKKLAKKDAERPSGGGKAGMEVRKGGDQVARMAEAAAARQAIKDARAAGVKPVIQLNPKKSGVS